MLSRPLESEICFACPSQLPKAASSLLTSLLAHEQTASTLKALYYAALHAALHLFATLTTANWPSFPLVRAFQLRLPTPFFLSNSTTKSMLAIRSHPYVRVVFHVNNEIPV